MGISIDALHRVDPQESTGTMTFLWLCAFVITLHPDGLFGFKSAGGDCVIQRDHCRELLVFWCFGVNHVSHEEKRVYLLVSSIFISFLVVGYQATGDFSEECPPMQVFCGWIVSATSNNIHIKLYPIIWFSRYRQYGGRPEMKFS
ncbi:hypothetical protein O0I10_003961 [Lichtheimia ornata]|uniref:Uncharacterized protein n=1 Tax=Lichtheimia ornata TaxID=688661 RepID=A0AAD7V6R3_9FUNG|nr:uncharacterized protein O0I10_003961 [Lichtheimia ornata]KAJ8660102.1 hypothetical protein O0I10_003961 [Lichtheimia ornata]